MREYSLTVTEDEALVLFELFARFDDSDRLEFVHAAEYLAIQKLSAQIDRTTSAPFKPDYRALLDSARRRIADGFDGDVPGLGKPAS